MWWVQVYEWIPYMSWYSDINASLCSLSTLMRYLTWASVNYGLILRVCPDRISIDSNDVGALRRGLDDFSKFSKDNNRVYKHWCGRT